MCPSEEEAPNLLIQSCVCPGDTHSWWSGTVWALPCAVGPEQSPPITPRHPRAGGNLIKEVIPRLTRQKESPHPKGSPHPELGQIPVAHAHGGTFPVFRVLEEDSSSRGHSRVFVPVRFISVGCFA